MISVSARRQASGLGVKSHALQNETLQLVRIANDFSRCLVLSFAPVKEFAGRVDERVHRGMGCRQMSDLPHHQLVRHGQLSIMHQ